MKCQRCGSTMIEDNGNYGCQRCGEYLELNDTLKDGANNEIHYTTKET